MDDLLQNLLAILLTSGLLTILLTRHFERTSERRKLYANAYKTVLSWQEMLYRVRRRSSSEEENRKLVNKFHDLQEELDYYQGLISLESESLGRSYKRFVNSVKDKNRYLIQQAWEANPRKAKDGTPKSATHPSIEKDAENFLNDIRDWHSWWQIPKIWVIWRSFK